MNAEKTVSIYVTELQPLYKLFAAKVQELAYSILKSNRIVPHSVTAREKSAASLKEKIERDTKAYENPLNEITDLAGVRIITYFPKDVDQVLPLIESEFVVDTENSVDRRNTPDPSTFGYASVHLVVEMSKARCNLPEYSMFRGLKCEIQVRTILQHAWAEIEHNIVYKTTDEIPFELQRKFASLAGLLEVADREFEMLRREEKIVRERISKTIKRKEFNMSVNRDSLVSYLKQYHKDDTASKYRTSRLIEVLKEAGIGTIQQLHDLLDPETLKKADKQAEKVRDACILVDRCLIKYVIAIGIHFGWSQDKTSELAHCPALKDPEGYKKQMQKDSSIKRRRSKAKRSQRPPNKPDSGDANNRA